MQPLLKTKGIQEQESMRKNYSPTANMGQDKDMRTEDTRLNAKNELGQRKQRHTKNKETKPQNNRHEINKTKDA